MSSTVFREFFFNEKLDFKNLEEDTIVIFDTNTLLNIYRYSNNTREKLIKAISNIRKNIWMPYQVGLEFNLNRRNIIEKLKKNKEDKKRDINETITKSINALSQRVTGISLKSTDAKLKKNEINDFINETLTTFHNELAEKVEELYKMLDMEKDLASEIAIIFEGNIGDCYTQEQLNEKLKEAPTRYERKIPPGYQDSNKNSVMYYNGIEFEQKYGDLIVWNQILDKASEENINKVVFVTDDNKEDWWYSCEKKTIGPRAELKNEMLRVANADFYMLNANSFLNNFSDSDETKDLIENEVSTETFLNNTILGKSFDEFLSNWSKSKNSVIEQGNEIEIPLNSDPYKLDYYLRQPEERRTTELNALIKETEERLVLLSKSKNIHIEDLRRMEEEYNYLATDETVPPLELEMLKLEIETSRLQLDLIKQEINKSRNKHADLYYEYNRLMEFNHQIISNKM